MSKYVAGAVIYKDINLLFIRYLEVKIRRGCIRKYFILQYPWWNLLTSLKYGKKIYIKY